MNTFNSDLIHVIPDAEKRVLLLKPRGFCAGVVRAIDIVRIALETFGATVSMFVKRLFIIALL